MSWREAALPCAWLLEWRVSVHSRPRRQTWQGVRSGRPWRPGSSYRVPSITRRPRAAGHPRVRPRHRAGARSRRCLCALHPPAPPRSEGRAGACGHFSRAGTLSAGPWGSPGTRGSELAGSCWVHRTPSGSPPETLPGLEGLTGARQAPRPSATVSTSTAGTPAPAETSPRQRWWLLTAPLSLCRRHSPPTCDYQRSRTVFPGSNTCVCVS